tara:strand:- start:247 stop:741 length:495 start_codon:yes stop_codon:yes gene_type:complete
MIIQCVNCNKNFEVDSSLIPENGRNIQCGSCNYIWFYRHIDKDKTNNQIPNSENDEKDISPIVEKKTIVPMNTNPQKKKLINIQNSDQLSKTENSPELSASSKFDLGIVLSYMLVSIITCIAIVIIMDTFKSPLTNIFPGVELLLYNLFETIEDMFLFFKNLLI